MSGPITKRRKTTDSVPRSEVKSNRARSQAAKQKTSNPNKNDSVQLSEDDDDDCKIIEQEHPLIILDMTDGDIDLGQKSSDNDNKFLLKVHFGDAETFAQLKETIGKGIQEILYMEQKCVQFTETSENLTLTVVETEQPDNDIFMVDRTPTGKAKIQNVPSYDSSFSEIFQETAAVEPTNPDACMPRAKRTNQCFNCDGDHSIRDCSEPKNWAKIRKNRANFTKVERYHIGNDQKYAHLQPGVISQELRYALGLRKDELPLHVYRMRLCGYPPGWLENAKILDSGISLIDSADSEKGSETKEQGKEDDENNDKFDLNKLISYPGFNVQPKSGTRDDTRYHRVPPMQMNQSKEAMITSLSHNAVKSYKRKKLLPEPIVDKTANRNESEMEIDDDKNLPVIPLGVQVNLNEPPLPCEPVVVPPPPPPENLPGEIPSPSEDHSTDVPYGPALPPNQQDASRSSNDSGRSISPTLEDLAEQKRLLLEALEDSSLMNATADDSLLEHILASDSLCQMATPSPSSSSCAKADMEPTAETLINNRPTVTIAPLSEQQITQSKEMVLGTPVFDSVSLFATLPESEKWSVGVSEVIDFENLPESTGKYDKMKSILNRVRVTVKDLHSDD